MAETELFEQVVEASGLNQLVARFTVSRLLLRADVAPDGLDPGGLARALPEIEQGIRVYLTDEEADRAAERLRALAERPAS